MILMDKMELTYLEKKLEMQLTLCWKNFDIFKGLHVGRSAVLRKKL